MHSKVQRSATDALCVMKMGQEKGKREREGYVVSAFGKSTSRARAECALCIVVVSYAQQAEA